MLQSTVCMYVHRDIVYQRRQIHTLHSYIHEMIRSDEIAQKQFRMIYYRIECLRCLFSFHSLAACFFQKINDDEVFFVVFLFEYIGIESKRLCECVHWLVSVHAFLCIPIQIHNTYNTCKFVLCMHASLCFGDFI